MSGQQQKRGRKRSGGDGASGEHQHQDTKSEHEAVTTSTRRSTQTLWVKEPEPFVDRIGEDLMVAFCCCFVHADRLMSLMDFTLCSQKIRGEDSVAHFRNLHTMFWLAAGSIWEATDAVYALNRAGIRKRVSDLKTWKNLQDLAKRWRKAKWLHKWRNRVAYHVDADLVREGLSTLEKRGQPIKFAVTEDRRNGTSSICFGLEAVLAGMHIEEEEFQEAAQLISDGHMVFSDLVHLLFVEVAQNAGLDVVRDNDIGPTGELGQVGERSPDCAAAMVPEHSPPEMSPEEPT